MGVKTHAYDEDRLVELIVEKQLTFARIAEELGISESLVKKISCGLKRPELQRKMWDVENGLTGEARRLGARYAKAMIGRQIRLGMEGEGEPARRAREFVLKFAAGTRGKRSDLPRRPWPMPQAMAEQMAAILGEEELEKREGLTRLREDAPPREPAENAENAENGEEEGKE